MRQLFKKRYTKEGVRAFYSKDENEVHLTYPDTLMYPFQSKRLFADALDVIRHRHGIDVTWTAYGDRLGIRDDSSAFSNWEEVIL